MLELLQARSSMTGAELAQRLEVDGRTVRRYVLMLQDMGIPVEAAHGRHGGYRLRPGFKLPPLIFTREEAVAVTLGLLAARHFGLTEATPAAEGALAKMERVLPLAVAEEIRALEESIDFSRTMQPPSPAPSAALLTLSFAARSEQGVWMRYQAADGAQSERRVDPYGLVFHRGRWYVSGMDHRSGEVRAFRVDRVQEATPTSERFERPAGFDPLAHVMDTLASVPWGYEIEVLLETSVEAARTMVPPHVGHLEEVAEGAILRTQTEDVESAARWLATLRCPFIVLRPDELRGALRQVAEGLLTAVTKPRQRTRSEQAASGASHVEG